MFSLSQVEADPSAGGVSLTQALCGDELGGGDVLGVALGNFMTDPEFLASALSPLLQRADATVPFLFIGDSAENVSCKGPPSQLAVATALVEAVQRRAKARLSASVGFFRDGRSGRNDFRVNHAKWAVVCRERSVRVVVLTANFIPRDWFAKTQGVWSQEFPRTSGATGSLPTSRNPFASRFGDNLRRFLERLSRVCLVRGAASWLLGDPCCEHPGEGVLSAPLPVSASRERFTRVSEDAAMKLGGGLLGGYDFSGARAVLVATAPLWRGMGPFPGGGVTISSIHTLRCCLACEPMPELLPSSPLVLQFSSVGALLSGAKSAVGTGMLASETDQASRFLSAMCQVGPSGGEPPRVDWNSASISRADSASVWTTDPARATDSVAPVQVIYPSVADVAQSLEGWPDGGSALPSQSKRWFSARNPKRPRDDEEQDPLETFTWLRSVGTPLLRAWRGWDGSPSGRQLAMPHIKTFLRYSTANDGSVRVLWAMMGSQNLSSFAWGVDALRGSRFEPASSPCLNGFAASPVGAAHFELGVLLLPSLLSDTAWRSLPVPYRLPPPAPNPLALPWFTPSETDLPALQLAVRLTLSMVGSSSRHEHADDDESVIEID
jgi:hypothetical protein